VRGRSGWHPLPDEPADDDEETQHMTTMTAEVKVGDRVRILNDGSAHDLRHFMPVGEIVTVGAVNTYADNYLLRGTIDWGHSTEENGTQFVRRESFAPVGKEAADGQPRPARRGDKVKILEGGSHGFPVGTVATVLRLGDIDRDERQGVLVSTRANVGDITWEHGVCAYVWATSGGAGRYELVPGRTGEIRVGDRVRLGGGPMGRQADIWAGMECEVLREVMPGYAGPQVYLQPLSDRPDGCGRHDFYWEVDDLTLV
jgi:hypothetical protein